MKVYVFAISLLMCWLACHAREIQGYKGMCAYKNMLYSAGVYDMDKCIQLTCQYDGEIVLNACPPPASCPEGYEIDSHWSDPNKPFPICCGKVICTPILPDNLKHLKNLKL
ncbi:uncharacterized protein LOC114255380 [Monomorium pharaonis]|uniref:uncharacterized protein LOC114255380 n=1 Tax=Monomorium pharaonis TaxID=307658 RepID=UPI00102E2204|nr:uncharacterized protein LOC114255380 [Monomorium pharaonis]